MRRGSHKTQRQTRGCRALQRTNWKTFGAVSNGRMTEAVDSRRLDDVKGSSRSAVSSASRHPGLLRVGSCGAAGDGCGWVCLLGESLT